MRISDVCFAIVRGTLAGMLMLYPLGAGSGELRSSGQSDLFHYAYPVAVPISLAAELIGYDVFPSSSVMQPESLSEGDIQFVKGQVYNMTFYWRVLEPLAQIRDEVTVTLNGLPIAFVSIQSDESKVGAIHQVHIKVRVPLAAPTGRLPLYVGPDILNRSIEIGSCVTLERGAPVDERTMGVDHERAPENLIRNGSFEQGTAYWQLYEPKPLGVVLSVDEEIAYDGGASALVEFSGGTNPDVWRVLSQDVLAKPLTRYKISYYLKTEHINTPCGVKLEVADLWHMQRFVVGVKEFVSGTQDWTHVSYDFRTPDFTRGLTVRVRRYGCGLTFGSAWFDRVILTEVQ